MSSNRKPAFDRKTAKQYAGKKMCSRQGEVIYNSDAYLQAGGVAYDTASQVIQYILWRIVMPLKLRGTTEYIGAQVLVPLYDGTIGYYYQNE
jgi:hypothetical protein